MEKVAIYCAHDEVWPIEKIIPNPRNPNTHPEKQLQLLAKIIKGHGWRAPITVSKRSGFVVRGHGRLAAALLLGLTEAPVDLQDYASEAEEYADMIADNRIAELAEIDEEELQSLVAELDRMEYDTGLLGFTDKQIQEMLAAAEAGDVHEDGFDVDAEAAAITEPESKPGNIYQLGNHRLMCGDSTNIDDVLLLMGGATANLAYTDPPYNVEYEGKTKEKLTIKNDSMSPEEFYDFLFKAFGNMARVTAAGGAIYVWHADRESINFRTALLATGWKLAQGLIWCKNVFTLGRQDYQWSHEPCLYGWKAGGAHKFYGGRKQETVISENYPVTVQEDADGGKILSFNYGTRSLNVKVPSYEVLNMDDVNTLLYVNKPTASREHPTMKPIALVAKGIINSSVAGDKVLDLFGGSGSTLIACEQLGRACYTMELSPKYCDLIVKRWEKATGNKAVKIK